MDFILNKRVSKIVNEYCKINDLDINEYLNELIEKAHVSHVYGEQPAILKPKSEKPVLEDEKNNVDLEKEVEETPTENVVEKPVLKNGGIRVVEMDKPKIRVLK